MSAAEAIEVYRSLRRDDCLDRAFMLGAVGIVSETHIEAANYLLTVERADAARAREQLALYEGESRQPSVPRLRPSLHRAAWIGCALYAAVLLFVALAVANDLWRPGAFEAGTLDAGRIQAGQWWRAWTALTLHVDGEHLLGNLLVGSWFGYLAGRQQGPGHAWVLVVTGAAASNVIEALLAPANHQAVGASTAVFTALGLLSAYTWGTHARWAQRWALQWAPLVGGLVLLAWFGSGDSSNPGQVDVLAHVLGFAVGVLFGLAVARPVVRQLLTHVPQWLTGLIALAELAAAWSFALHS
jgi:membrane associated rhomboid family serine protease